MFKCQNVNNSHQDGTAKCEGLDRTKGRGVQLDREKDNNYNQRCEVEERRRCQHPDSDRRHAVEPCE